MKKYLKIETISVPRFNEANGFYTTKSRSASMSKIRSQDTAPELLLRKSLYKSGVRYRINYNKLPGKPDVVILKHDIVIFIDGEFWHGYNWKNKKAKIKSNREFWIPKIERNIQRDAENNSILKAQGFKVFRFWQHEIERELDLCIEKVLNALH